MNSNRKPKLHVVVHVLLGKYFYDHTEHMTNIARVNGADSVLLIPDYTKDESEQPSRKPKPEDMLPLYAEMKKHFPDFVIGVNLLHKEYSDQELSDMFTKYKFDSYQSDGSIADKSIIASNPNCTFFSGIAFKYGPDEKASEKRLVELCKNFEGKPENLIATTSGAATGVAADIEKIRTLSQNFPERRLAIASGVDVNNVSSYLQAGVTDFIVATSLLDHVDSEGYDILSPEKVKALADIIHSHK